MIDRWAILLIICVTGLIVGVTGMGVAHRLDHPNTVYESCLKFQSQRVGLNLEALPDVKRFCQELDNPQKREEKE